MTTQPIIRAIIGLGNPGQFYVAHRHNIGFKILDALAQQLAAQWHEKKEMAYAECLLNNQQILLIKPMAGMNVSGIVIPYLKKRGIAAPDILVVHDELEIAFGKVAVRTGGSARGHNGLRSLIAALGTDNFMRLRFGIGRPEEREQVPHYVLSSFSEPRDLLEKSIEHSIAIIQSLCGKA